MANYIRKTKDVWILEEDWGYGWEYVNEYADKHSARVDMSRYEEDIADRQKRNLETYSVRIRKKRVNLGGENG